MRCCTLAFLPVEVVNQALVVARAQPVQQQLVFPVETQEVGHGDGLLRQAGEGLHHVVLVQTQEEVVPCLCAAGQDFSALLRTRQGGLFFYERMYWKYKGEFLNCVHTGWLVDDPVAGS